MLTMERFLKHRWRYEFIAVFLLLLLVGLVNATTIIIERIREDQVTRWISAFGLELTGTLVILPLIPLVAWFIQRLNVSWGNARWRVLWHIPAWIVFSLLHVSLFVMARKLLWALAGETYRFGNVWWGLLYEMRKGLIIYLAIVLTLHAYWFIVDRLQGQADLVESSPDSPPQYPHQFLVKMLNRQFLVRADAIDWVQSASNYVILHCADRSYPMRLTMTAVTEQLDPRQFVRIHRTAIVNIRSILAIKDGVDAQVELTTGATLPVSKTYQPELRQALNLRP
ncbi:MAG: LytTR family DNA-binding domain-containing protein [Pseudohongiella sp.]|nr:LytTR family DNA-binding domain-containing protein [Pseudohongiella sp.]